MKRYICPTISIVTVECSTLMSLSVKDDYADGDSEILVKEEANELWGTEGFGNDLFGR